EAGAVDELGPDAEGQVVIDVVEGELAGGIVVPVVPGEAEAEVGLGRVPARLVVVADAAVERGLDRAGRHAHRRLRDHRAVVRERDGRGDQDASEEKAAHSSESSVLSRSWTWTRSRSWTTIRSRDALALVDD